MNKKWIKYIAFSFLLAGIATPTLAQHPEGPMPMKKKRDIPSPENNAKRILREFKKDFRLTDKEYDKVYDLYLAYEKSLIPEQANGFGGGMPPRGGMGGPGGGFGGPGGGFGGPGGFGMGMPPQGAFPPRGDFQAPGDLKSMMEEMRKQQEKKQEKAAKKLKKKMKKILKGEAYVRWEHWEAERKHRKPDFRH